MTRPMVGIQDLETGEVIIREMNDEEWAENQAAIAAAKVEQEATEALTVSKAALLAKLGITENEAKLLLG